MEDQSDQTEELSLHHNKNSQFMPNFHKKDNYLTPKTSFIPIIIVMARKILIIQTFWYQCWVILLCVLWC